ncbi:MAG: hypothetical protein MHM6MM_005256 [Cercozoa sp. M6MM]
MPQLMPFLRLIRKYSKLDEAIADAEKCIKIKPDCPEGYMRKGLALLCKGKFDAAAETCQFGMRIASSCEAAEGTDNVTADSGSSPITPSNKEPYRLETEAKKINDVKGEKHVAKAMHKTERASAKVREVAAELLATSQSPGQDPPSRRVEHSQMPANPLFVNEASKLMLDIFQEATSSPRQGQETSNAPLTSDANITGTVLRRRQRAAVAPQEAMLKAVQQLVETTRDYTEIMDHHKRVRAQEHLERRIDECFRTISAERHSFDLSRLLKSLRRTSFVSQNTAEEILSRHKPTIDFSE